MKNIKRVRRVKRIIKIIKFKIKRIIKQARYLSPLLSLVSQLLTLTTDHFDYSNNSDYYSLSLTTDYR